MNTTPRILTIDTHCTTRYSNGEILLVAQRPSDGRWGLFDPQAGHWAEENDDETFFDTAGECYTSFIDQIDKLTSEK